MAIHELSLQKYVYLFSSHLNLHTHQNLVILNA